MPKGRQLSPGRRQYLELKRRYPDVLLLVRMGDFYETFDEDARTMARVLDIALTARDVGGGVRSPLAGIPYRSLESYLGRLIGAGLRVAVCEQTSDPAASKGIVDRAVVRVVTPGTVMEPGLLDQTRNNYLAAAVSDGTRAGLAYVDISTSDFTAGEMTLDALVDELERLGPSELLADPRVQERLANSASDDRVVRPLDESRLDAELAEEALKRYFDVATLEPYGCEGKPLAVTAAAAVVEYLSETQPGVAPRTGPLRTFSVDSYVRVDRRVARDLELFEPMGGRQGAPTLLSTLDRTKTAMGGRLFRAWLARPLFEVNALRVRQDGVERFVEDGPGRAAVRDALSRVPDLERLTNRVRSNLATPRDLVGLARGLGQIPTVQAALAGQGSERSQGPGASLSAVREAVDLIEAAIAEDAPAMIGEGDAIREGFDEELDETRSLAREARAHIARIESEAREQTGIKSLKVGYNKVFGYYIEVSRSNLHLVPSEFERRQTLVNGERFVTQQLKELEARILTARERIGELERSIFRRVCGEVAEQGERIMASARALGEIDSLAGLAEVAAENGYVRPELNDGDVIEIVAGRHPVVEAALGPGRFVPNDTRLSSGLEQILIVTGPNMSGKSTYIRQVAVLVLMAQVGSFVPAERAAIGVVDRVFTRAGLSDDIAGGRSTFMVEMVETAFILSQATPRSLVVLDEIGRGTSTYDGLAIARAVAEYIHNSPRLGCKTLFATHYHEMTALADLLPRAINCRVAVAEEGDEVVFLHRIVPGGADRSYGVHVGRLAGLPRPVVNRAWEILGELENAATGTKTPLQPAVQLSLLDGNSPVLDELLELDVNSMTPLDAMNALYALQKRAGGSHGADGSVG